MAVRLGEHPACDSTRWVIYAVAARRLPGTATGRVPGVFLERESPVRGIVCGVAIQQALKVTFCTPGSHSTVSMAVQRL
jgi:hypothetical protein